MKVIKSEILKNNKISSDDIVLKTGNKKGKILTDAIMNFKIDELFHSLTGTGQDINLNKNIYDYKLIEILFYGSDYNGFNSVKFEPLENRLIELTSMQYSTNQGHILRGKTMKIEGNSIKNINGGGATFLNGTSTTFNGTNYVQVYKVLGYKLEKN